ncbi:methyltransferase [Streptomyces gamaensis]|uniref:Methyltransferase n=1 Tax=Streptomyces gamaensis TaxID=1763542 RepID=A0ABW0YVI3_9ACTN
MSTTDPSAGEGREGSREGSREEAREESPFVQISEHAMSFLHSAALRTAAQLRVADQLADGPRTVEEIATATGVSAPHLLRVLRLLATRDVFREDRNGSFHLTPKAELLRSDVPSSMREGVLMVTGELFWKPAERLDETVRDGRTVFDDVFGGAFFDYFRQKPEAGAAFDVGMASLSEGENATIADAYPFPATGTVVDVGGGRGGLLRQVLLHNPGLTGVLYDQESVIRDHHLDGPELEGRWETRSGDFFASVPEGADVYMFKRIFHDWTDEECRRILRACRTAMKPGSKLLVLDAVIEEGNAPQAGKTLDVLMLTSLNGRERGEAEFRRLLTQPGLRVTKVIRTSSPVGIVEVTAE